MPSEYELVTSQLLYYPARGFEVKTPLQAWYTEHQAGSPLVCSDWEQFADPRQTTYAKYTELALMRETYVDGILQSMEDSGYDAALSAEWRKTLARIVAPLRFPVHGFQMISAYVGQMAPSGRITIAALFQAADEVRRVQRIAYRMAQLRLIEPTFGAESRTTWERDPAWQPLREAVERCLVTYDWGEALIALNVCLKPLVDDLFMVHLPAVARSHGDPLLGQIFGSLDEDCRWHREWTVELLKTAFRDRPENRTVVAAWVRKWRELAQRAAAPFDFVFPEGKGSAEPLARLETHLMTRLGLEVGP